MHDSDSFKRLYNHYVIKLCVNVNTVLHCILTLIGTLIFSLNPELAFFLSEVGKNVRW